MSTGSCPVCGLPLLKVSDRVNFYQTYSCGRCGLFALFHTVNQIEHLSDEQRAILSGTICEQYKRIRNDNNPFVKLEYGDIERIKKSKKPDLGDRAIRLLKYISEKSTQGSIFKLDIGYPNQALDAPLWEYEFGILSASYCSDFDDFIEILYLLNDYLAKYKGYIEFNKTKSTTKALSVTANGLTFKSYLNFEAKITPEGWGALSEYKSIVDKNLVFVAMKFGPETGKIWSEGIEQGILAAKYNPGRVDRTDHNNRIDDEIMVQIRKCNFMVADFTFQNRGVYFEAGFAQGLSKDVIWVCRDDSIRNKTDEFDPDVHHHFDVDKYNFLVWKEGEEELLSDRLKNRIVALKGEGSYEAE